MAGFATDTHTITISVKLPDGSVVIVEGVNDGVNGFEWSASREGVSLACDVEEHTLIDGVYDEDDFDSRIDRSDLAQRRAEDEHLAQGRD